MTGGAKFGIAAAMILFVLATAPALLCAGYIAQTNPSHDCCPQKTAPPKTAVPTCCVQSPAVASQSVDVPAPDAALATELVRGPLFVNVGIQFSIAPDLDSSPPGCSSILRI
jgi:hypothetical protein